MWVMLRTWKAWAERCITCCTDPRYIYTDWWEGPNTVHPHAYAGVNMEGLELRPNKLSIVRGLVGVYTSGLE